MQRPLESHGFRSPSPVEVSFLDVNVTQPSRENEPALPPSPEKRKAGPEGVAKIEPKTVREGKV